MSALARRLPSLDEIRAEQARRQRERDDEASLKAVRAAFTTAGWHGERYVTDDLSAFMAEIKRVRYASFEVAEDWYETVATSLDDDRIRLLALNDRYYLGTRLLNRIDLVHPWQYDRAREVEARPDGYIDLWARFHGKSSWITQIGGIQEILRNPELTICIFSGTATNSQKFLRYIMSELENNLDLKRLFPDVLHENVNKAPLWSIKDGIIVKRKGNPKESTVFACGLINALPTGSHFALHIYDDIIDQQMVTSPEMVTKATTQYELSRYLGIGEATRRWHIGTRYFLQDTYALILERGTVKPRIYPATDNGKMDGRPVYLTESAWEKEKRDNPSTVAAQMLQNPMAGNENVFSPQWFRSYPLRPETLNVYIMCDPSLGSSASSDRTAIAVVGMDRRSNLYLLDGYRHRMALSDRINKIIRLWKKWSAAYGVQMVRVGYERYGAQSDVQVFNETMERDHGGRLFEIIELNWARQGNQSKRARVERLEPYLRLSQFFLPPTVWRPSLGECEWSVPEDKDEMSYRAKAGPTRAERSAKATHQGYRIIPALKRSDEAGNAYDLTAAFFEEASIFPFGTHDDLIDVTSRVFDMDPVPPIIVHSDDLEPQDFPDA